MKIVNILEYVIDIQNDIRLTKFLTEYSKADSTMMTNPSVSGPELCYLSNILNGLVDETDVEMKRNVDEKVIGWMKRAYSSANLDMKSKSTVKDLICILLDIILYHDAGMVNSAFTLLARYFQQKNNIITYA